MRKKTIYRYETSDGQTREEVGYFRDDEELGKILNVRGSYGYYDDSGMFRLVRYVADENGYREENEEEPPAMLPPNAVLSLLG